MEKYESLEFEVVTFEMADVIVTSGEIKTDPAG